MADGGFKSFWELGYMLRGLEQLLVDLVANPEFVTALMEKLLELNLRGTRRFLEIAGPYIHVFRAADDLATQTGLLMSPEVYRTRAEAGVQAVLRRGARAHARPSSSTTRAAA